MHALITRIRDDGKREKVLVHDWAHPPATGTDQVRIQPLFTGVTNGTERNGLIDGNYAPRDEALPTGSGYQNVGRVIEVGADVADLEVGDLIFASLGDYEYCLLRPGSQKGDGLYLKLSPEIDLCQAALFGVSGVAMRCCRNADLRMDGKFLVVGAGFVGQMAAQIGNVMGARVTICDIDQNRLDIAERVGAVETAFNVSGDGWVENIEDSTCRAVLDVAGVVGMEDRLIRATGRGGSVLFIAGRFKVEYTFNLGQSREINIKQNSHFDNDDLANLCRLVSIGLVNLEPLIQDVVPVDGAKEIYDKLRDTPHELLGTVFNWKT